MRFWDSSALVTLVVAQAQSEATRALPEEDGEVVAWTLSDVEMRSALARLQREQSLTARDARTAARRLEDLWQQLHTVRVIDAVKMRAKRLLQVHALRAADALQLGAALTVAGDEPRGRDFVCLDSRLGEAAHREGFTVLPRGIP